MLSGRVSAMGTAVAAALAVGFAVVVLGWDGAVVAGATVVVAGLCALGFRSWLGGVTGDALGAVTQLSEIVVLVVLVGLR